MPTRARLPDQATASTTDLLPVEALTPDGLLVRSDGTLAHYLAVTPINPLALDAHATERLTSGLTALINLVPPGMSIQCYVQATPIALEDLLQRHRHETRQATARHDDATRNALRRLASLHADSVRRHADAQAALDLRYVLVVPFTPPDVPTTTRTSTAHDRAAREARAHAERLRAALSGLDIKATMMTGVQIADLLRSRFAPTAPCTDTPHLLDLPTTPTTAARLRRAIAQRPIDTRPRRHLIVDGAPERTIHLNKTPERTFYGWLLHPMQSPTPWTLSVHIHARDRQHDRDRENRRARRLWGVNEGAADRRARPDRQQHDQQLELERLVDELSTGAQSLTDVSVYLTIRAATTDDLHEATEAARRELANPVDAGTSQGDARQPQLWRSNLPLGLNDAKTKSTRIRMISRNAADTIPFVSAGCGSPSGLPLGFADPGRTLERLDPFDRTHDNSTMLLFAKSGGGKTMTSIALASDAITRGCQVNVIDRSPGHYRFLADLIPSAAHIELGDEQSDNTINPWDVDDPDNVPRSKVAFLVRLHALLIGDHVAEADSYGLGPLERNLLAVAIRKTYTNAADGDTAPGESALHATLGELAATEDPEAAAVCRNLAHRLSEYTAQGTYGHLFDRPTTIAVTEAPLIVFNTHKVADDVAAPLLFAVLEYISQRVERRHHQHLRRLADGQPAAGPFDGTSAVVVEELWKPLAHRATGAWVIELVKRARHIGLWFVAITQQRSDLDNAQGRALLDNSTMQVYLRNGPTDLAHIADARHLIPEEVDIISRLSTEKGSHAQAYVVNGERGRGAVTIRLGSHLYWLATSDPISDIPLRNLALRQTGGDPFAALDLLADPAWRATSVRAD